MEHERPAGVPRCHLHLATYLIVILVLVSGYLFFLCYERDRVANSVLDSNPQYFWFFHPFFWAGMNHSGVVAFPVVVLIVASAAAAVVEKGIRGHLGLPSALGLMLIALLVFGLPAWLLKGWPGHPGENVFRSPQYIPFLGAVACLLFTLIGWVARFLAVVCNILSRHLRVCAGAIVLASIFTAWVFWPRPIEGFWNTGTLVHECLCEGCKFLYFKDGRVYYFHENHGGQYWGAYTQVSPGVYNITGDDGDKTLPPIISTVYVHGLVLRWADSDRDTCTVWRLFNTTKPRQLLDIVPIETLAGKRFMLKEFGIERPQSPPPPDQPGG